MLIEFAGGPMCGTRKTLLYPGATSAAYTDHHWRWVYEATDRTTRDGRQVWALTTAHPVHS